MKNIHKTLLASALLAIAVVSAATPAYAEDKQPKPAAAKQPKDKTLLDTFYAGGALMWPLLACSIGTAAVAVYCLLQINSRKMLPQAQAEAIGQFMQVRDASSAYSLCHSQPNVFANTMAAALLKVNFERDLANNASEGSGINS